MSNVNAPTRSVLVQTTLRVIENSDEGTLVVSDRGCQTAIAGHPSLTDFNLLPLLEFIPYSEIDQGGIRFIQLPRKAQLQFNFSENLPSKTASEVAYKSVLKKSISNSIFPTLTLPYHQPSNSMAKIFEDQICQTDLTVSPYILEEDAVANVRREIGAQTSVTFDPSATISDVEPRLKEYLSHSHCFISIYLQGKFSNLEDYQKQTGRYEPIEELQELESVSEKVIDADDASRTTPQQTEISISKTQKNPKGEQDVTSLDYQFMTDEEFEENIGKILNKTVKNVTDLMNRVVEVYERRPNLQKDEEKEYVESKDAEPSEFSIYHSIESEGTKEVESEEVKKEDGDEAGQLPEKLEEEVLEESNDIVELPEKLEEKVLEESNDIVELPEKLEEKVLEGIETKTEDVEDIAEKLEEKIDVKDTTEAVDDSEIKPEDAKIDLIEEIESDVVGDVQNIDIKEDGSLKSGEIELAIRRTIEELLEPTATVKEITSPVGDTPEIKRETHIECECAHPREGGAAPPILSPPPEREEPKKTVMPEKIKDTDRIVVEAVAGKAVTLELIVTKTDDTVLRDSISCPETCSVKVPSLDRKEQIIRLSVVLPKTTVTQHYIDQSKTTDDRLIQRTQSDTQTYVSQKPSIPPCGCAPQSKTPNRGAAAISNVTSRCIKIEEVVCGDDVLETCVSKKEDECVICSEEDLFREMPVEICNCLSMQSYEENGIVSIAEAKRKNEATLAQLCKCSKFSAELKGKPGFCYCFELPFSDDEDDSPQHHSCSLKVPFVNGEKREDKTCTCDQHIEVIYPQQKIYCGEVQSVSSTCTCVKKTDFLEEETCICGKSCACYENLQEVQYLVEEELSQICSYCRNLQKGPCAGDFQEEEDKVSIICTCGCTGGQNLSKCRCPERDDISSLKLQQKLLEVSCAKNEIVVQDFRRENYICGRSVEAQTMFTKGSTHLIYQQSRNVVEPYMDKLRDFRVEAPQVREPSLLYLRDRRSIEQYMKTLDPEDARDMIIKRAPTPKKSSIKDVTSKQMAVIAVKISSTTERSKIITARDVLVRAAAWKVGEEIHSAFDTSTAKDTLTYVTNEEEVRVVERDSTRTPVESMCSTGVGPDDGNFYVAGKPPISESNKEKEVITARESVKFLFVSNVVATPTQSQIIPESKRTQNTAEFLSNLEIHKMPCLCQQDAKDLASSEPTPNLTCLFEDDTEYHEGYMEEMTDESVSVQTQLILLEGKVRAASLPDMVNDTNRCDSKMEMPWLRISLPPAGYYQIEKMDGRPRKKTCDCWKLDTKDSIFLAEPVVQNIICPTKTPDEYKALNLDGENENNTADSDEPEIDDTPGVLLGTDHTEADETIEDRFQTSDDDGPQEREGGEEEPVNLKIDKKICVCLSTVEEDECAEFKKPTQFVYDNLCYEANETYLDTLYKLYPDDCDTECGSKTEIPWQDIVLPKRVKLRATKKPKGDVSSFKKPREFTPLFESAAMKEAVSKAKSDRSGKSDKSQRSQKLASPIKMKKQHSSVTNSPFEIEFNFSEIISNLINIEGGAASQATVSQMSAISDIRMAPKRCQKDYIITVRTASGTEQRTGIGKMQTVGSQTFQVKADQTTALEFSAATTGSKTPEQTKSCEVTEVNYDKSVVEKTKRKAESMPNVPSKSSNISEAFAKFLVLKSSEREATVLSGHRYELNVDISQGGNHGKETKEKCRTSPSPSASQKPARAKISKESGGASSSLRSKDPILVMVRSTGSKESRGTYKSSRTQDTLLGAIEINAGRGRHRCKDSKESKEESQGAGNILETKEPILGHLNLKVPIKSATSKESRGVSDLKRPVTVCDCFGTSASKDPIMEALETYQQEMKPLRESLNKLKAKIRDLNLPEFNNWPQKYHSWKTPPPCPSTYPRDTVRYPSSMTSAAYGMSPPNMQMPFGMGSLPVSSFGQNFYPLSFPSPQTMYRPSHFGLIPPQQFQPYPSSRIVACKGGRSKSRIRRRDRKQVSSKSSSEISDSGMSGEDVKCPFFGTTSAVSCASLPKSCSSKVKKKSSKTVCICRDRQKRQRQAKTEPKSKRERTYTERCEKATRTDPDVKIHFPPRNVATGRGKCKSAPKASPYTKDRKVRVAVRITPSGRFLESENTSGDESCFCKD